VALRLAAASFAVELLDLEKDNAENVRAEIVAGGGKAEAHGIDATDEQQVKTVIADVSRRHGRIDAVANIAGGTVYLKRIEELTWE
jgi:NAD(P)-dependent dehydrogenase (short-subunit alcohol dehydrogenase family)